MVQNGDQQSERSDFASVFETQSPHVAQSTLEFTMLLPLPLECCDDRPP